MKKLLLCALLSLSTILPTLAEDLVLTFGNEYCNEQLLPQNPTANFTWQVEKDGMQWDITNFWHVDDMSAIKGGLQTSNKNFLWNNYSTIKTKHTLTKAISEVSISFDELDSDQISKIELYAHEIDHPSLYGDPIEFKLEKGIQTVTIPNPAPNLYYTIQVTSFWTTKYTGFLQISQVVYKELVEKKDVTLDWGVENVSAVLGDDTFVAPVLTCEPDDEAVKELIQYNSTDENVATINAAGKLTLVGAGETTISAVIEGSDAVKAATASYKLTVETDPNTLLLLFNSATLSGVDDSSSSWKIGPADESWTIKNFSISENGDGITCGKDVASITTDFIIDDHLKEIVLTISDLKEGMVDNITLYAYGANSTKLPIESIVVEEVSEGNIVFDVTAQPGLKYNIVVNCNTADAAGAVTISKIAYRKATEVNSASQATLYVSEVDSPNAEFTICDATVYASNDNWVVLKFDTPESHSVWHRFVNGDKIIDPVAKAPAFISRATADADRHGFNQYAEQSFKHVEDGTLEYYTENADGTRSAVNSVVFSGVTSVNEIDCDYSEQPTQFYNLQGIRIERPTATGTYIVRRGNKTEKVFISRGGAAL